MILCLDIFLRDGPGFYDNVVIKFYKQKNTHIETPK